MKSYLPKEIEEVFREHFSFPEKPLVGSVASIHNHTPRLRTMRIYEFNDKGCPILLTHTGSNKWKEFMARPQISILSVNENKLLQVLTSGLLILETSESVPEKANYYWSKVRPDVKKIYDPKHRIEELFSEVGDLTIPKEVPSTFGIACLIPTFWELLHLDSEYTKSHRTQFQFRENQWQKQRVHVG